MQRYRTVHLEQIEHPRVNERKGKMRNPKMGSISGLVKKSAVFILFDVSSNPTCSRCHGCAV